jgi:hypothetical protein
MHRRYATRRLTKVFTAAVIVFSLAVLATPEASPRSSAPQLVSSRGPLAAPTVPAIGSLPIHPIWRPAGEVLKRSKAVSAPALPFGPDLKDRARGESLSRWHRIYTYSTQYRVTPELARRIFDAAITAGIEPELGFRLVRVESEFNPRAVSPAGALGLTQLMLGTAREFQSNVTRDQLLDPFRQRPFAGGFRQNRLRKVTNLGVHLLEERFHVLEVTEDGAVSHARVLRYILGRRTQIARANKVEQGGDYPLPRDAAALHPPVQFRGRRAAGAAR